MQHIRVISAHHAAPRDYLRAGSGEVLIPGKRDADWPGWIYCTSRAGVGAWVPETYLELEGLACKLNRDYDATELTVEEGDLLEAVIEESGWLLCVDKSGRRGWIPAPNAEKQA
jgi:hypothetical protein